MRRSAIPVALVLTLGLAACVPPNERTDDGADDAQALSGTIAGAGSSAQAAAMAAWIAGFTDRAPGAQVNYDPSGSGAGRDQFLAGAVDFAGSDAYLDEEELALAEERCGEVVEVPLYISPIAVVYNLEGVEDLQLSGPTIAGIFNQQITSWDDPAVAADNPALTLPDQPITPVNRSDESGTTENFTEYLAAAAPEAWPHEASGDWPVSGGEAAQGNSGVIGAVQAGAGTIGYADASQAGDLGIAKVKVGDEYVEYSAEAAAAVVEASPRVEGRGEYSYALDLARDTTESGTYPIVLVSYQLACTDYDDEQTAGIVQEFLRYVASGEGQQAAAQAAGSAPISEQLRDQVVPAIDAIHPN